MAHSSSINSELHYSHGTFFFKIKRFNLKQIKLWRVESPFGFTILTLLVIRGLGFPSAVLHHEYCLLTCTVCPSLKHVSSTTDKITHWDSPKTTVARLSYPVILRCLPSLVEFWFIRLTSHYRSRLPVTFCSKTAWKGEILLRRIGDEYISTETEKTYRLEHWTSRLLCRFQLKKCPTGRASHPVLFHGCSAQRPNIIRVFLFFFLITNNLSANSLRSANHGYHGPIVLMSRDGKIPKKKHFLSLGTE